MKNSAWIISKNICIAHDVKEARSFQDRLIGLMFKTKMSGFDSLLIQPCNSIHTCFMKYPIDVLFLDESNKIVHIIKLMKPWRFSSLYLKSKKVLELYGGILPENIKVGDEVSFQCLS
jgi:uncharacterized membrane protein (UPF0127 family)